MGERNNRPQESLITSIIPLTGANQAQASLLTDSEFTQAMGKYFPNVTIEGFGPVTKFVGSIIQAANVHAAIRHSSKVEQKRVEALASASRKRDESLVQIAKAQQDVELARISAGLQSDVAKIREWGETERLRLRLDHEYKMHETDRYYDLEERRIMSSERRHQEMVRTQRLMDNRINRYCERVGSMCDQLLKKALEGDELAMSSFVTLHAHWERVLKSPDNREEFLALADKL